MSEHRRPQTFLELHEENMNRFLSIEHRLTRLEILGAVIAVIAGWSAFGHSVMIAVGAIAP